MRRRWRERFGAERVEGQDSPSDLPVSVGESPKALSEDEGFDQSWNLCGSEEPGTGRSLAPRDESADRTDGPDQPRRDLPVPAFLQTLPRDKVSSWTKVDKLVLGLLPISRKYLLRCHQLWSLRPFA